MSFDGTIAIAPLLWCEKIVRNIAFKLGSWCRNTAMDRVNVGREAIGINQQTFVN